jgi:hypothetical protein
LRLRAPPKRGARRRSGQRAFRALEGNDEHRHARFLHPGPSRFGGRSTTNVLLPSGRGCDRPVVVKSVTWLKARRSKFPEPTARQNGRGPSSSTGCTAKRMLRRSNSVFVRSGACDNKPAVSWSC